MHYEYSPNDYDDKHANVITKMCDFKKALQITCKLLHCPLMATIANG